MTNYLTFSKTGEEKQTRLAVDLRSSQGGEAGTGIREGVRYGSGTPDSSGKVSGCEQIWIWGSTESNTCPMSVDPPWYVFGRKSSGFH